MEVAANGVVAAVYPNWVSLHVVACLGDSYLRRRRSTGRCARRQPVRNSARKQAQGVQELRYPAGGVALAGSAEVGAGPARRPLALRAHQVGGLGLDILDAAQCPSCQADAMRQVAARDLVVDGPFKLKSEVRTARGCLRLIFSLRQLSGEPSWSCRVCQ